MEAKVEMLSSITACELDDYLQKGWYRMQQRIFTAHLYEFKKRVFPLYWARVNLEAYKKRSKPRVLKKNRDLRFVFIEAEITPELENLFQLYAEEIDFEHSPNIQEYLLGKSNTNLFPTRLLSIYHHKNLIGACYFDEGKRSTAGILNFFDPAYKQRSLGLLMMYQIIEYSVEKELHFFYPGYIAPGYAKFDYKLAPGPEVVEIRDPISETWLKHGIVNYELHHLKLTTNQLIQTQTLLFNKGVETSLWFNAHYHSIIWKARPEQTMNQPFFLFINTNKLDRGFWELVTYDLISNTHGYYRVTGDIWRYDLENTNGCICSLKLLDQQGPFTNALDIMPYFNK